VQLELLVIFVVGAVLLGLAVGNMVRDQLDARERALREEQETLQGRVKATLREGRKRVTRSASEATRRGAWWMLRQRLQRNKKPDESE